MSGSFSPWLSDETKYWESLRETFVEESKICMYYLIHPWLLPLYLTLWIAFKLGADDLPAIDRDLNRLVMDYLVIEGYKSAAEEFSQEAGLTPPMDFESIESRMDIREALQRGDVEDAITRVNDLNPEVSSYFLFLKGGDTRGRKGLNLFHAPLLDLWGCC